MLGQLLRQGEAAPQVARADLPVRGQAEDDPALLADAPGRHEVVVRVDVDRLCVGQLHQPVSIAHHLPARAQRVRRHQEDRPRLAQHTVLAVLAVDPLGVEGLGVVELLRLVVPEEFRLAHDGRQRVDLLALGPLHRPRDRLRPAQGRRREQGDHDPVPFQLVDDVPGDLCDRDLVRGELVRAVQHLVAVEPAPLGDLVALGGHDQPVDDAGVRGGPERVRDHRIARDEAHVLAHDALAPRARRHEAQHRLPRRHEDELPCRLTLQSGAELPHVLHRTDYRPRWARINLQPPPAGQNSPFGAWHLHPWGG